MSLKIWITGNGSIKNLGSGTLSGNLYGSPVYEAGKMGKCLRTNYVKSSTLTCEELSGATEFSISFWFKMNTGSYELWHDIFTINVSDGTTEYAFRMETCSNTGNRVNWFGAYFNSGGLYSFEVTNDVWYHQTVVVSPTTIYQYINGELAYGYTVPDAYSAVKHLSGGGIAIGNSGMNCSLNDIRVYDHCLSKKEIHEIYKSLILHYPLNNPIVDLGENLLTNSWDMSGWTVQDGWLLSTDPDEGCTVAHFERTEEDAASGNIWRRIIPPNKFNPDDYPNGITVSFDFKCDDKSIIDRLDYGRTFCSLQIYNSSGTRIGWYENRNTWGAYTTRIQGISSNNAVDASNAVHNGEWCRLATHFTQAALKTVSTSGYTTDDVSYTTISFQLVRAGTIHIRRIKAEAGSANLYTHSPYSLNRSDTILAGSDLAAGNTTVTDCSGYGNNGSASRNLAILSSTALGTPSPRYNSFTFFSDNDYINCGNGTWVKDSITINVWVYSSGWGTDPHLFSCTEAGGFDLFEYNSKIAMEFKTSTSDTYLYTYASIKFADLTAGWHMFSWTFDGYDSKLYIDGVLEGTTHVSDSKSTLVYSTGNNVFTYIHAEAGNNGDVNAGYHAVNMSDFRIYATALSAEDIKELYQTPFSIDKNGNVFGYNFMEV